MGRQSKSRALSVWMNGERVGDWRVSARGGQEFVYVETWLSSRHARPISLSMPLRPSNQPFRSEVEPFFENLLPDNRQIRERIQRRFHAVSTGAFDLLQEIGRDCVGALQIMPEEQPPTDIRQITADRLTRVGVSRVLAQSLGSPFAQEESSDDWFRISLAGAQEKIALLFRDGVWYRPTGTTPTTHILKLPLGVTPHGIDLSTSVENEWLCSEIIRAYGIDVARCWMETFGEYKTLVVERFDRRLFEGENWYLRLPQEDFCQASGTPPGLKYESDGGPGIGQIMELLLGSEDPSKDMRDFMHTQLIFWMLAAIDGHAKNFSIFILPGGAYRLTPRYDVLSAFPMLGAGRGKLSRHKIRMAMAVTGKNRHYRWSEMSARHWQDTARRCGFGGMKAVMEGAIARTPAVIAHVQRHLPKSFPAHVAEPIIKGLAASAEQLAKQLEKQAKS